MQYYTLQYTVIITTHYNTPYAILDSAIHFIQYYSIQYTVQVSEIYILALYDENITILQFKCHYCKLNFISSLTYIRVIYSSLNCSSLIYQAVE